MIGKKYQIIYADPPWEYKFSKDNSDKIENHYPTMPLNEIKRISFPSAENAVLYLWTTAPKLQEAIEVIIAWGFEYKTHAIWDKGWIGMGYWFRNQHELLLVGTKGKVSPPKDTERIGSIIRCKKTDHSKKPESIRDLITTWFPTQSKLELFARPNPQMKTDGSNTFDGWDVWGNEVESDIKL